MEAIMRAGEREPGAPTRPRPRRLDNLYDVFREVRDDEAAHWRTLANLVQHDELHAPEGCPVVPTEDSLEIVEMVRSAAVDSVLGLSDGVEADGVLKAHRDLVRRKDE